MPVSDCTGGKITTFYPTDKSTYDIHLYSDDLLVAPAYLPGPKHLVPLTCPPLLPPRFTCRNTSLHHSWKQDSDGANTGRPAACVCFLPRHDSAFVGTSQEGCSDGSGPSHVPMSMTGRTAFFWNHG
ncbi:hypothetical protein ACOMHN_042192 [Nucella lapillus]